MLMLAGGSRLGNLSPASTPPAEPFSSFVLNTERRAGLVGARRTSGPVDDRLRFLE